MQTPETIRACIYRALSRVGLDMRGLPLTSAALPWIAWALYYCGGRTLSDEDLRAMVEDDLIGPVRKRLS